jgi:endo-1,4-beta-xylanase
MCRHSIIFNYFKRLNSIQLIVPCLLLLSIFLPSSSLHAQPAVGANKFLGNITQRGQVRSDYGQYWNQITGENESKWESVEGTRDQMNWGGTDRIAEYARENNIPWKFHCLVWGSQYPRWMNNLSQSEQLEEIEEWLDLAAERYPDCQMIDVINEAYPSHKPPPFKNALGGDGSTGFDWMINIFKMARERWPNAILIYNDYNTIEWNNEVNWQEKMAKAMKQANSEMDAIGVQAHDAWKISTNQVKSNIDKLAATGYPIVVSEYDIGESNDGNQKRIMEEQFTMFWEHPKIIGVTYWGYVVGQTWRNGTGLLNSDGRERPALTWLVDYVKNNPNPPNDFPDMLENAVSVCTPKICLDAAPKTTFFRTNPGRLEMFNLQGRITGTRIVNSRSIPLQSMMPSQGSYIVRIDGQSKGVYNKVR